MTGQTMRRAFVSGAFLLALVAGIVAMMPAAAQAVVWMGTGNVEADNLWTDGTNWDGTIPNSDTAVADFTQPGGNVAYLADAGTTLNQLNLNNADSGGGIAVDASALGTLLFAGAAPAITQSGAGAFFIAAPVVLGADLTVGGNGAGALTVSGPLSGAFNLTKSGASTLVLSNPNSTFGGTGNSVTISGGILQISDDAHLGNTANTITLGGGTLQFSGAMSTARNVTVNNVVGNSIDTQGNSVTMSGVLGGDGALTVKGSTGGKLIVTSDSNNYGGGTTIDAGATLQIGDGGATGAISYASGITNNGTLIFDRTTAIAPGTAFVISGTGSVVQNRGTLTLTAASNYTGGTTLNGGTLIAQASGTTMAAIGTGPLTINGGALTLKSSSGTIEMGNATTITNNVTITLTPSGGTGTTYKLGTLSIGANSVHTAGGFSPSVSFTDVTVSGAASFSSAYKMTLGSLTVADSVASGTTTEVTLTGTDKYNTASSVTGVISDNASDPTKLLAIRRTSVEPNNMWALGANTYSGGTTIDSGSISLEASSTGTVGNVTSGPFGTGHVTLNGGRLYSNKSGYNYPRTLLNTWSLNGNLILGHMDKPSTVTLSGDGTIVGASRQITTATNSDAVIDGAIGDGDSDLGLIKAGTRVLTLSGANTYGGQTDVNAGTLRVGHNTALGSTTGGTVVASVSGAMLELANGVTVTGESLTIDGDGSLTNEKFRAFSGANTWDGPITVNVDSAYARFGITSGASLTISGSLTINGTNTSGLVLQGDGTGIISGNISGNISGTGTLTRSGNGSATWILAGTNTYGTTTISGTSPKRALTIGNGGATGTLGLGAVGGTGTLIFNRSNAYNVGNDIGGSLNVVQNGSGTLTLSAANTYSDGTAINAGTLLAANASGTSATGTGAVTVGSTTTTGQTPTLAGAGFISGTVTVNGDNGGAGSAGHVAPGAPGALGTLTVGGLTLNGGSILDLDGTSSGFDLIDVTGLLTLPVAGSTTVNVADLDIGLAAGTAYHFLKYQGTAPDITDKFVAGTLPAAFSSATFALFSDVSGSYIGLTLSDAPTIISGTWSGAETNVWSVTAPGNWSGGVPSAAAHVATFDASGANTNPLVLDESKTVGKLEFTGGAYTLGATVGAAEPTLTLDNTDATPEGPSAITAAAGSHTINAKVLTATGGTDLEVTTSSTGALNLAGTIANVAGRTVTLSQTAAGPLTANALTVSAIENAGTLVAKQSGADVLGYEAIHVTAGIDGTGDTEVGTTGGATTAELITAHVRQDTLTINAGSTVTISTTGGASGTSVVNFLQISNGTDFDWSAGGSGIAPASVGGSTAAAVPEPATWLLAAMAALAGLVAWRRHR